MLFFSRLKQFPFFVNATATVVSVAFVGLIVGPLFLGAQQPVTPVGPEDPSFVGPRAPSPSYDPDFIGPPAPAPTENSGGTGTPPPLQNTSEEQAKAFSCGFTNLK